jgi:hypothetical protein
MVIGNGMLAKAFSAYLSDRETVIFASGVSDSQEVRQEAFERERNLLLRTLEENAGKSLVYFGTCSVFDSERRDTPYVLHKLDMEALLRDSAGQWMVLRLPLAIGPTHRTRTLAQYIYDRIVQDQQFEVWAHATRYPVDVADAYRIASLFMAQPAMWNRCMNVALRAFRILDFVRCLEQVAGKAARYELLQKGEHYDLRCPEVLDVAGELQLDYSEDYLGRVLRKYFPGLASPGPITS